MLRLTSVRYILMSTEKRETPKTSKEMMNFRIFCELLAKMMLETIDFTMVFRGYRRNEKPETLGIATFQVCHQFFRTQTVEMKSPRHWALQQKILQSSTNSSYCRNEKPERVQKNIKKTRNANNY